MESLRHFFTAFRGICLVTFFSFAFASAQEDDGTSQSVSDEPMAAKTDEGILVRGRWVYLSACAGCHGKNGDGRGVAGRYLRPVARDFTTGVYRFRTTPSGELPTDNDIYRVVSEGAMGTFMPGFKDMLSERDMRDVVAYIKTFAEDFAEYGAGKPIPMSAETPMTKQTIADGKAVYMIQGCWTCHGVTGMGDGPSAATQTDAEGNALPPLNFVKGPYKMGMDKEMIYMTINAGLDGSPMAAYKDLFAYGNTVDMKQYEKDYTKQDIAGLKTYLSKQLSDEEINGMDEAKKKELVEARKWSLIHYILSLYKKPGIFSWLFVTDVDAMGVK